MEQTGSMQDTLREPAGTSSREGQESPQAGAAGSERAAPEESPHGAAAGGESPGESTRKRPDGGSGDGAGGEGAGGEGPIDTAGESPHRAAAGGESPGEGTRRRPEGGSTGQGAGGECAGGEGAGGEVPIDTAGDTQQSFVGGDTLPPISGADETQQAFNGGSPNGAQQRRRKRVQLGSPSKSEPALHALTQSMGGSHATHDPPHMGVLAGFHTGAAVTMGGRVAAGSFMRTNSNPGPGSYDMGKGSHHSRYSSMPRYSFGGSSRFGLGTNPNKERPGPGHYGSPKDPTLERVPRVGFGGAPRADIANRREAPGPGAYELKSCLGEGKMFTAGGRFYGSSVRSRMLPGPGAYDPADHMSGKYCATPKVGFGTSTREDFAARREREKPGPGTYDSHMKKAVGSDAAKFSIRSRRKIHDLTSYIEPGPGHYASHASSFAGRTF